MQKIVREKIVQLMSLGDEDLAALPKYTEEVTQIDQRQVAVGVHHEVLPDGSHKIVVQVIQNRYFGISTHIDVAGFIVARDGVRREVAESELWDYS